MQEWYDLIPFEEFSQEHQLLLEESPPEAQPLPMNEYALFNMPKDILFLMLQHLSVIDIMNLSFVNKAMYILLSSVENERLIRYQIERDFPTALNVATNLYRKALNTLVYHTNRTTIEEKMTTKDNLDIFCCLLSVNLLCCVCCGAGLYGSFRVFNQIGCHHVLKSATLVPLPSCGGLFFGTIGCTTTNEYELSKKKSINRRNRNDYKKNCFVDARNIIAEYVAP